MVVEVVEVVVVVVGSRSSSSSRCSEVVVAFVFATVYLSVYLQA